MFLMDKYFDEYYNEPVNGTVHMDYRNFHVVLQEQNKLMAALPVVCRNTLLDLMYGLTNSSTGIIDYNNTCRIYGKDIIHSMVGHKLVHVRPTSRLAYDVPSHSSPAITAESPAALVAMKKVLARFR